MKHILLLLLVAASFSSCRKCYDCTGTGVNGNEFVATYCSDSPEYDYIKAHSGTFTNSQVNLAICK